MVVIQERVYRVVTPGRARSRTERDVVVRGRVAAARERAGGVVVRVAVRPRARALEHRRVVDGPRSALALVRRAVRAAAAVLVRVESRARARARHRRAGRVAHGQVRRAHLVQVGHAAGRLAVVRAAVAGREAAGGRRAHRQIVPVHQRHVVEVQPARARERRLEQRHGRHAAGAVALDLVACAVNMGQYDGRLFAIVIIVVIIRTRDF